MNVPFVPVRGLLGTDYMRVRGDFKAVPNPYDPREEIALVPAVAPDVAVFHGWQGDRHGNVVTSGTLDAKLIAQASRRTVATVEEIVSRVHPFVLAQLVALFVIAFVPALSLWLPRLVGY